MDEMIDMIGGEGLEREQQQLRLCQLLIGLGGTKEEATKKGPDVEVWDVEYPQLCFGSISLFSDGSAMFSILIFSVRDAKQANFDYILPLPVNEKVFPIF